MTVDPGPPPSPKTPMKDRIARWKRSAAQLLAPKTAVSRPKILKAGQSGVQKKSHTWPAVAILGVVAVTSNWMGRKSEAPEIYSHGYEQGRIDGMRMAMLRPTTPVENPSSFYSPENNHLATAAARAMVNRFMLCDHNEADIVTPPTRLSNVIVTNNSGDIDLRNVNEYCELAFAGDITLYKTTIVDNDGSPIGVGYALVPKILDQSKPGSEVPHRGRHKMWWVPESKKLDSLK